MHTHNPELLEELIVQHYGAYIKSIGPAITMDSALPYLKNSKPFVFCAKIKGAQGLFSQYFDGALPAKSGISASDA